MGDGGCASAGWRFLYSAFSYDLARGCGLVEFDLLGACFLFLEGTESIARGYQPAARLAGSLGVEEDCHGLLTEWTGRDVT